MRDFDAGFERTTKRIQRTRGVLSAFVGTVWIAAASTFAVLVYALFRLFGG